MGRADKKSIDPVVFFKICLVEYLENITTDRGVMNHCAMRLDILYFLNYGGEFKKLLQGAHSLILRNLNFAHSQPNL